MSRRQSVVNGWLGSSGHKANIENPNFTSTGVGVASDASGRLYWTQNFGNDTTTTQPPPAPPPPAADTQKPSAPAGLTVGSIGQSSLRLRWSASSDNVAVAGYRVYRGSARLATTTGTSYTFTALACGTRYTLGVEALDAAGNVSARRVVTVSTRSCRLFGGGF